MVFSTPVFLFYFLVLTLLVYYVVPRKLRNLVLLISSLCFYYWGERSYTVIMLLSTAIDFTHGMLVEHFKGKGKLKYAKLAVASSMFFNLALLFFFKYWDFMAGSLQAMGLTFMPVLGIHLPIGISFYTFQTMSYTIDVYRGDTRAQRSIINFGTFVTLFPQLIAGPIIKYKDLGDQIDERTCSADKFASGVRMFMVGLGKKLLIANNVGMLWEAYKAMAPEELTVAGAWLGVLAFTFQIYFDFSGYSDMAVGLGRMLGFEFLPNFNYPYISKSITEFWRRWHISLSTWFREYLYIPLGGNRCSKPRWMFNLLVVWAATGIWHGASWNYLIWGLYFFVLLMLEKFCPAGPWTGCPPWCGHVYTLFFVLVSWAIFAIEDFSQLTAYLPVMFGLAGAPLIDGAFGYYLRSYLPILCVAALASTPLGAGCSESCPAGRRQGAGGGADRWPGWWCAPPIWWTAPTTPSSISASEGGMRHEQRNTARSSPSCSACSSAASPGGSLLLPDREFSPDGEPLSPAAPQAEPGDTSTRRHLHERRGGLRLRPDRGPGLLGGPEGLGRAAQRQAGEQRRLLRQGPDPHQPGGRPGHGQRCGPGMGYLDAAGRQRRGARLLRPDPHGGRRMGRPAPRRAPPPPTSCPSSTSSTSPPGPAPSTWPPPCSSTRMRTSTTAPTTTGPAWGPTTATWPLMEGMGLEPVEFTGTPELVSDSFLGNHLLRRRRQVGEARRDVPLDPGGRG